MNPANEERHPVNDSPVQPRGRIAGMLRDGAWIAGAIALYLLLQLVVLPRLGYAT